jgi:hypothetical protein
MVAGRRLAAAFHESCLGRVQGRAGAGYLTGLGDQQILERLRAQLADETFGQDRANAHARRLVAADHPGAPRSLTCVNANHANPCMIYSMQDRSNLERGTHCRNPEGELR